MAVENIQQSSWCCFFTANPIGVKSGSNVLIHKPEVQIGCVFGFDSDTNCTYCATSRRYNLSIVDNGTVEGAFSLVITFSGDQCTQFQGTEVSYNIFVSLTTLISVEWKSDGWSVVGVRVEERLKDTCKNITFPQLRWGAIRILMWSQNSRHFVYLHHVRFR